MERIYVFDMGRVILKSTNLKRMYEKASMKCDYQTFKNLFYSSPESIAVYSGILKDDEFFEIIKNKTESEKDIEELKQLYLENKGNVYSDTVEIIKKLKEAKNIVCLLSNLKVIDYQYLSSVVDMGLFDKVFLSYLLKMAKPDKKIYEAIIKELRTNDFYFFDDSKENVENALELGIHAIQTTGDDIGDVFSKTFKDKKVFKKR